MRIALVLLAACGRIGFEAHGAPDDAHGDAFDAAAACEALYCDDFEAPDFDARWMLDTFHGTLALDTTRAHSGRQAVHSHIDPIVSATTNVRATLLSFDALPVTGTLYVRMWAYFTSPQTSGFFDQIINLADAAGDGMSMGSKDGFFANNDYTAPTQYTQSATALELFDHWTCLVFEMPTGTIGTSRVVIDGSDVTDIAQTISSPQPAPTHIYLGTEWVGTPAMQQATDAWFDDVTVAITPLSCN